MSGTPRLSDPSRSAFLPILTGRARTITRRLLLWMGAPIVTSCAFMTIGALLPGLPVIGTVGTLAWPSVIGTALIITLAGTAMVGLATLLDARRTGLAFSAVAVLALAGTTTVLASQVATASSRGVDVDLAGAFSLTSIAEGEPDERVRYADHDGAPLGMDVYLPRKAPGGAPREGGAPVVMYVHGGGWVQGSPDEAAADLRWFADRGYLVFAPRYTLATEVSATWDIAMPQIGCALVWLGTHAGEYGGDPERIFLWGASAGGNLAMTTTYAAANGELTASCEGRIPPVSAVAAEVPAVAPASLWDNDDLLLGDWVRSMVRSYIGGSPQEHPERLEAVTVGTYLSSKAPPSQIFVSRGDHLVPVEGVDDFVVKARKAGVELDVVERPFADHVVSGMYHGIPNQTMLQLMDRHFAEHGAR